MLLTVHYSNGIWNTGQRSATWQRSRKGCTSQPRVDMLVFCKLPAFLRVQIRGIWPKNVKSLFITTHLPGWIAETCRRHFLSSNVERFQNIWQPCFSTFLSPKKVVFGQYSPISAGLGCTQQVAWFQERQNIQRKLEQKNGLSRLLHCKKWYHKITFLLYRTRFF